MRILLHIDDIEAWRDALAERLPDAEIVTADDPAERRRDADYLAVWKPSEALLREQTRTKGIVNLGAGVDALLNNPARPEGDRQAARCRHGRADRRLRTLRRAPFPA